MKALVVGGSGYTGGELLRILVNHPRVDGLETTSRTYAGHPVSNVHPNLRGVMDAEFKEYKPGREDADVVFLALPHGQSMEYAPKILDKGIKLVDLSADYRIKDRGTYEKYYVKHKNPELLENAVYGLPELFREDIIGCDFVANPGCYTTAAILSLAPMADYKNRIEPGRIIVDAKSGTSGAGAKPSEFLHHPEVDGNLKPYKVVGHRHQPEIDHVLNQLLPGVSVSFTPTLVPVERGIVSNAHVFGGLDGVDLQEHYRGYYSGERFIRIVETAHSKSTLHSNYCDISTHYDGEKHRAVLIAALDNLVKGAAGQAVQNMNIMMKYAEDEGLNAVGPHP